MRNAVALLLALIASGGLAAWAGARAKPSAVASAPGDPPRDAKPRVVFGRTVRVHFRGNHEVSEAELRAMVWIDKDASPSGDPSSDVVRDVLARDILLVNAGYYDRGFLLVQIGEPVVTESKDEPVVDILVPITKEGPRIRLQRLTIYERGPDGQRAPALDGVDLRARVALPDGAWFARNALVRDLNDIRTFYRDHGYANVEVEPQTEIDAARATVDVEIPVRRGPLVHIERIDVVGNKKTSSTAVLGQISLRVGDLFNETKLVESKRRVQGMGGFQTVDVSTQQGADPTRIVIAIEVVEK